MVRCWPRGLVNKRPKRFTKQSRQKEQARWKGQPVAQGQSGPLTEFGWPVRSLAKPLLAFRSRDLSNWNDFLGPRSFFSNPVNCSFHPEVVGEFRWPPQTPALVEGAAAHDLREPRRRGVEVVGLDLVLEWFRAMLRRFSRSRKTRENSGNCICGTTSFVRLEEVFRCLPSMLYSYCLPVSHIPDLTL